MLTCCYLIDIAWFGQHGATYTCDVEFKTRKLHEKNNWVIDIGQALDILSAVLGEYNFKNLDEVFPDESIMTTTGKLI